MSAVFPAHHDYTSYCRSDRSTKTKLAGSPVVTLTVPLGAACSKPVNGRSCGICWIGLYTRPVRQMLAVSRTAAVARLSFSNDDRYVPLLKWLTRAGKAFVQPSRPRYNGSVGPFKLRQQRFRTVVPSAFITRPSWSVPRFFASEFGWIRHVSSVG